LQRRLGRLGLNIHAQRFFTSAMATAQFLDSQRPSGTAFAIGESGLTSALHDIGYILTEHSPDYVVLAETTGYSYDKITKAVRLIAAGARFIATNPDVSGPSEAGITPACGAMAALIEKAGGRCAVLCGQTQSSDDAQCPALPPGALGERDHGRRSHGHRHRGGHRKRHGDYPSAHWCHQARTGRSLPPPAHSCLAFDRRDQRVTAWRRIGQPLPISRIHHCVDPDLRREHR